MNHARFDDIPERPDRSGRAAGGWGWRPARPYVRRQAGLAYRVPVGGGNQGARGIGSGAASTGIDSVLTHRFYHSLAQLLPARPASIHPCDEERAPSQAPPLRRIDPYATFRRRGLTPPVLSVTSSWKVSPTLAVLPRNTRRCLRPGRGCASSLLRTATRHDRHHLPLRRRHPPAT